MSIRVKVGLKKTVEDIDKGNDFIDEVRELLQGKITCRMSSGLTNHNPKEELTEEPESE